MAVHLPLLARLYVASPCTADWSAMAGDDRARHCGKCKQTVYNLSDMTREAAEALLLEKNGDLCVRYFARRDGTILTADCPVGVSQSRKRKIVAIAAAALATAGAASSAAYRMLGGHHEEPEVYPMMGALPVSSSEAHAHEELTPVMGGSASSSPASYERVNPPPSAAPLPSPPHVHAPVSRSAPHSHMPPMPKGT